MIGIGYPMWSLDVTVEGLLSSMTFSLISCATDGQGLHKLVKVH
jgi:hypothetical protein